MSRIIILAVCIVLLVACGKGQPSDGHIVEKASTKDPDLAQEPTAEGRTITVYKSPTCGCCGKWADHLEKNGFRVVLHDTEVLGQIKSKYGVPADMQSCHTATIGEYVIEGHVPAADIEELLKTKPPQRILAVPGMPLGSPGMEDPRGSTPYDSLLVGQNGNVTVFRRH